MILLGIKSQVKVNIKADDQRKTDQRGRGEVSASPLFFSVRTFWGLLTYNILDIIDGVVYDTRSENV